MATEPTYEVKIKDDEAITTPPAGSAMSPEEISSLIESKSAEKATAQVEKLKEDLANSISGNKSTSRYGKDGPESWDKFQKDTTEDAVKLAEERMTKKYEDQKKQEEVQKNQTVKQQEETMKAGEVKISQEWSEAVADGLLPDIDPQIKQKLQSGTQYSQLTEEERNDAGIKSYNEVRILHAKLNQEGKSSSLYRTVQKYYNADPAGKSAPVMGGSTSTGNASGELTYDQIVSNRKKRFGF